MTEENENIILTIRQKMSGVEHTVACKPTLEFSVLKREVAMLYGLLSRDYVLLYLEKVSGTLPLEEEYPDITLVLPTPS